MVTEVTETTTTGASENCNASEMLCDVADNASQLSFAARSVEQLQPRGLQVQATSGAAQLQTARPALVCIVRALFSKCFCVSARIAATLNYLTVVRSCYCGLINVASRHLPAGTEDNYENPQSGQPVLHSRFEPSNPRCRSLYVCVRGGPLNPAPALRPSMIY
jgi:hypothetical protein